MKDKERYTVGEMAGICNLSKKTLRFYDEKGLLKPMERDGENQYRYYTESQILKALIIREMRQRGFTLQEMRQMLDGDLEALMAGLNRKIQDMEREIVKKQEQLSYTQDICGRVVHAWKILESQNLPEEENSFELIDVPERTVLFTRYRSRINANDLFWKRYAELLNLRDQENITSSMPVEAIFHDHYFNQFFFDDGDLELILPISAGDLSKPYVKKMEGFQMASMVYVGRYKDLINVYVNLVKAIEREGYAISGPAIEQYLLEFSYGISEEHYVTRVGFPVTKKTGE